MISLSCLNLNFVVIIFITVNRQRKNTVKTNAKDKYKPKVK